MSPPLTLLLLPGLDGTATLFDGLVEALAWDGPIVPVAYPSEAHAYDALLAHVRERLPTHGRFVVVAESFSGPLAIRLAAEAPPGLVGLVLCATFASAPRSPGLLTLARSLARVSTPPATFVRLALTGWDAPGALVRRVRQAIASVPASTVAARLDAVARVDVRDDLARLDLPILYLTGDADRLVPRTATSVLEAHPRARAVELSAPHLVLQRQPVAAARAIEAFLAR